MRFVKVVSIRYNIRMGFGIKIEELIERLDNLRRRYVRDYAYSCQLNLRQFEALVYLSKCNHYSDTPLALTDYLGLTKGTVSQTVIALEEKGLLEKSIDPSDKRVVHLKLTPVGRRTVEKCLKDSPISKGVEQSSQEDGAEQIAEQLENLLVTLQRANSFKTFGVCRTCSHFRASGLGVKHQCGLTLEPLTEKESLKICREHSVEANSWLCCEKESREQGTQ